VPRYLSAEWFAAVAGDPLDRPPVLILEQVVVGAPDGTVTYRVEVAGDQARVVWPVPAEDRPADLRITTDWDTAVSVARGELSTQRALMEGRLRVKGSPDRLAATTATIGGVDPLPAGVRDRTTF
jgi:hypothetical protein